MIIRLVLISYLRNFISVFKTFLKIRNPIFYYDLLCYLLSTNKGNVCVKTFLVEVWMVVTLFQWWLVVVFQRCFSLWPVTSVAPELQLRTSLSLTANSPVLSGSEGVNDVKHTDDWPVCLSLPVWLTAWAVRQIVLLKVPSVSREV